MRHREVKSLLTRSRRLGSSPISPLPLLLSLFPAVAPLVRLLPGILCHVRPAEPRARRYVEVEPSEAARPIRMEVELGPVERERRTTIEVRAVDDWSEWDWRRPRIEGGGTGRHPDVLTANAAGAISGDEDLEPVAPDGNAVVSERTVQLRHIDARAERTVGLERARINVYVAQPAGSRTVEVQCRDPSGVVLEDGRAVVGERRVHSAPEILRGLPAEVVPLILAPGDEQIRGPAAARPVPVEIQPVTVGGEAGDAVTSGRVDVRPEVNRLAPGGVDARPLGDPDVGLAPTSRTDARR